MLIIPELQKVIILIPRTGSGSLRRAVQAKYPGSILLYRHMEADGVPAGYDRWPKFCVVRDPVERLFSLWSFMRSFEFNEPAKHDPAYIARIRYQAERPFEDWLLNNDIPFTSPYDSGGFGRYWPLYTVRHALPENRKSQFMYARPDLGTRILRFGDWLSIQEEFDIHLGRENSTGMGSLAPTLSKEADDYVNRWFAWDLSVKLPSNTRRFR